MKSSRPYCRGLFSVIAISLAAFLGSQIPHPGEAQAEDNQIPKIYLFVLEETKACTPKGYASYASDESSNCQGPDINGIVELKNICVTSACEMPSSSRSCKIKLGDLFETVSTYSKKSPEERAGVRERKSMVILLDWGETPISTDVTFRRIGRGDIKTLVWTGHLQNEYRWFNHQRLDAFYPMNKVKWTLKVGKTQWDLSVEP